MKKYIEKLIACWLLLSLGVVYAGCGNTDGSFKLANECTPCVSKCGAGTWADTRITVDYKGSDIPVLVCKSNSRMACGKKCFKEYDACTTPAPDSDKYVACNSTLVKCRVKCGDNCCKVCKDECHKEYAACSAHPPDSDKYVACNRTLEKCEDNCCPKRK